MTIKFREGYRIYIMKVIEQIDSENYRVVDGSIINKKDIIQIIK